jgi:hypothetical protein
MFPERIGVLSLAWPDMAAPLPGRDEKVCHFL